MTYWLCPKIETMAIVWILACLFFGRMSNLISSWPELCVCVCACARVHVCAEGVCATDPGQQRAGGSLPGLDRGALPAGARAQPAGRGWLLGLGGGADGAPSGRHAER